MTKISIEAFNSECLRWYRNTNKQERLGQRLMNAFTVGESNSAIFYEKDSSKASSMFYDAYVGM